MTDRQRSTLTNWARGAGLLAAIGVLVFLALAASNMGGVSAAAEGGNIIANPGFENGTGSWACAQCKLTSGAPAQSGSAAGQMVTTNRTGRAQLFQKNLTVQADTTYEVTFWAKSDGSDLQVDLQRQVKPYTKLGLNQTFDVGSNWQQFTTTFTAGGFQGEISNARLRFIAPRGKGHAFSIDNVSLIVLDGPPTGPTPTATTPPPGPTATPAPTSTPGSGGQKSELLVFDWNGPITTKDHGFPWDRPPMAGTNGNWKSPKNFAEGTFYIRAEVKTIPANQPGMKVQLCIWQDVSKLENCTKLMKDVGVPGTVVELIVPVQNLWKKDGKIIDWSRPRDRYGFAIKNAQGQPVSDYSDWHWNGENPDDWFTMNARLTVVVVEKGAKFSGWGSYIR